MWKRHLAFFDKFVQPGYGYTINMGIPPTMEPQGRRPPSLHLGHYYSDYLSGGKHIEAVTINLNALCGLPGYRRLLIGSPIYAEKPHHLRFNPVCHVAENGERSLRVTEWSTGKFLKYMFYHEPKVWEMSEARLNSKDPRWISRLQSLGLWPSAGSSNKVGLDDALSFNLEVFVIHQVCKLELNSRSPGSRKTAC